MSEMVERVASALQDAWDRRDSLPPIILTEDEGRCLALAMIEEMREATLAMVEAGRFPAEDDGPVACWQTMIDAALSPDRLNAGG